LSRSFADDQVRLFRLLEGNRALDRRTPVEELGIQEVETRQRLEVVDGARQHARHVVGRAVDRIKRRIADEGRIGREQRLGLFDRLGLVAQPVVRPREGQRIAVPAGHIGGERARLREVGDRGIQVRLRICDGAVDHRGQADEHFPREQAGDAAQIIRLGLVVRGHEWIPREDAVEPEARHIAQSRDGVLNRRDIGVDVQNVRRVELLVVGGVVVEVVVRPELRVLHDTVEREQKLAAGAAQPGGAG
jgi:hypothetical protein